MVVEQNPSRAAETVSNGSQRVKDTFPRSICSYTDYGAIRKDIYKRRTSIHFVFANPIGNAPAPSPNESDWTDYHPMVEWQTHHPILAGLDIEYRRKIITDPLDPDVGKIIESLTAKRVNNQYDTRPSEVPNLTLEQLTALREYARAGVKKAIEVGFTRSDVSQVQAYIDKLIGEAGGNTNMPTPEN